MTAAFHIGDLSPQATAAAFVLCWIAVQVAAYRLKTWRTPVKVQPFVEIDMPEDLRRFFARAA